MTITDAFFRISLILSTAIALHGCAGLPIHSPPRGSLPVRFTYEGPAAQSVCIAGNFNHWSSESSCLRRDGHQWVIDLMLQPGIHRYAFVVDGTQWVADPKPPLLETDGFGRQNSTVLID